MSDHPQKTKESILGHPAPRDIEWKQFITMWENYADKVEQESGDRLAVDMNGHRVVCRGGRDGNVGRCVVYSSHILGLSVVLRFLVKHAQVVGAQVREIKFSWRRVRC